MSRCDCGLPLHDQWCDDHPDNVRTHALEQMIATLDSRLISAQQKLKVAEWALGFIAGRKIDGSYPPAVPHALEDAQNIAHAALSKIRGGV